MKRSSNWVITISRMYILAIVMIVLSMTLITNSVTVYAKDTPGRVVLLRAETSKGSKGISRARYNKGYRPVELFWTKAKNATRYKILYSFKKSKGYKEALKATYTKGKAAPGGFRTITLDYKKGKTVYFRVIPYNGKTAGKKSLWVCVKAGVPKKNASSVKPSKKKVTLTGGRTVTLKAKVSPSKPVVKGTRWQTADPGIATVDNKGKITGTGAGKTYVYALAHNGVAGKITVTVKQPDAPQLKSVITSAVTKDNKVNNRVVFAAVAGLKYRIFRREGSGSYKQIVQVAPSGTGNYTYTDKGLNPSALYSYTVKQIYGSGSRISFSRFDSEGIMTLADAPEVTALWKPDQVKLTWTRIGGSGNYDIYSKVTASGKERKVGSGSSSYSEIFSEGNSLSANQSYLKYTYYLDPSINPLIYMVRAKASSGSGSKIKWSCRDGEVFYLAVPAVVSAQVSGSSVKLTWGRSPHAKGYEILNSADGSSFSLCKTVSAGSGVTQSLTLADYSNSRPYYTVRAYAWMNGKKIYSDYDKTFRVKNASPDFSKGSKVLFIGDSITYGTPYTAVTSTKDPYYTGGFTFSYPRRINQLTGVRFTNVSIPGATYTYLGTITYDKSVKKHCLTANYSINFAGTPKYEPMEALSRADALLYDKRYADSVGGLIKTEDGEKNPGTFKDYDVVILAAGTNDVKYAGIEKLGSSLDPAVNTDNNNFTGAVNLLLTRISEAGNARQKEGKKKIKVVFVDLLLRNNKGSPSESVMNTFQQRLDAIANFWNNKSDAGFTAYKYSHNFLTKDNMDILSSDYLHLTKFAQGQFGSQMADYLIKNNIIEQ